MRLWFSDHEPQQSVTVGTLDNTITLSEAFYKEIDEHRIPVEREVIAALAHAPGMLDFYVWTVWKSWTANGKPARIPLFSPYGLSAQLGAQDYSVEKRFRQKVAEWIRKVKALWPECPAEISADGQFLVVRSSRSSPAIRAVEKPVTR